MKHLFFAAAFGLALATPLRSEEAKKPAALAPSEIVAAAPKADWVGIAATDLLVMDLAPDYRGKARRVVIQLMPAPFSQGWIGNIRKLAAAHWWDGLSVNRVQDNYVVQWGDADGEDKVKARALPLGLAVVPESEYSINFANLLSASVESAMKNYQATLTADGRKSTTWVGHTAHKSDLTVTGIIPKVTLAYKHDPYGSTALAIGWAMEVKPNRKHPLQAKFWPVHCYGMVGVGRNLSPDTGTGAELYTVIGHAPRHLDRNIALVGRVIEGIENLSSLPRGTGALGFYEKPEERTGITSVRLGNEVAGLPIYEYLSTESASFAKYADARANRRDPFFIRPAGGADICNIPVPVRRVK